MLTIQNIDIYMVINHLQKCGVFNKDGKGFTYQEGDLMVILKAMWDEKFDGDNDDLPNNYLQNIFNEVIVILEQLVGYKIDTGAMKVYASILNKSI